MYSPVKKLEAPDDFKFPFEPYEIQKDLMKSLYETIENREIGIFESPTGTGKSLTLTCGALQWIVDHNELLKQELYEKISELKEEIGSSERNSDWIKGQFDAICKKQELRSLEKIRNELLDREEKLEKLRESDINRSFIKTINARQKYKGKQKIIVNDENRQDVPNLNSEDSYLVNDEAADEDDIKEDEENDEQKYSNKDVKIFFCSRTHSQLSQIAHEIKKTSFGKFIRCISLASRKNLCVNPSVKKLSSLSLINEKCLDMQKSHKKTTLTDENGRTQKRSRLRNSSSCPFKNQAAIKRLRDVSLTEILDIEDLVESGETLKACPYYSERYAIEDAQVILLPYQILLHRKTRQQTGINVKDSIIIIDEAHNLLDTINSIYSTEISHDTLGIALEHLSRYKEKYFSRLHTKTIVKLGQLIFIVKQLKNITMSEEIRMGSHCSFLTYELMEKANFSNMNIFELIAFCEKTYLAEKVFGLAKSEANKPIEIKSEKESVTTGSLLKKLQDKNKTVKQSVKKIPEKDNTVVNVTEKEKIGTCKKKLIPAVRIFLSFLESLMECADDGKVLIHNTDGVCKIKFVLLNPGHHFEDVLKECRSLIIAGGTMQPVNDLKDQLLHEHIGRVKLFVYGHVVPSNAVAAFAISKGPTNKEFRFTSHLRSNPDMISELARTLENVSSIVPGGIVCFFGSYAYLDEVYAYLKKNGHLNALEKRKFIYCEPRSTDGGSVDKVLTEYAVSVRDSRRNGAFLFSVVGGKLSEGLNFADDLGRCVIVVGLPYPNKTSPVLQEKMDYLNSKFGQNAGSTYYDNICMKSVNQSIGRSIRHINDYACVILLDERFTHERVREKLPNWILPYLTIPKVYGIMHGAIAKFFRSKKNE